MRQLKEWLSYVLNDHEKCLQLCWGPDYSRNSFGNWDEKVLSSGNGFMNETEINTPGFGLRLQLSKMCLSSSVSCFSSENAISGMLQASDYESVDEVLLILGSVEDGMYDSCSGSNVYRLFAMYSDLLHLINCNIQSTFWTLKDLETLKLKTNTIQNSRKNIPRPL